jgi:hypothetical protein
LNTRVEATGEPFARGNVEIEKRALLDRCELQAAGDDLREHRIRARLEPLAEPLVRGQLADHLLYAAL